MSEPENLVLRIDGTLPLSKQAVASVEAVCDAAESGTADLVVVQASGRPAQQWPGDQTPALVSRWERALRRVERLPAATVGVAVDDCGGLALDAFLATDYRIATTSVRLMISVVGGATWPGMALYRLAKHASHTAAVRRAVLFGVPVDAVEALRLHLVHEVTDDPSAALLVLRDLTARLSGPELALRRQLMCEASTTTFEEALGVHLAACDRARRQQRAYVTS